MEHAYAACAAGSYSYAAASGPDAERARLQAACVAFALEEAQRGGGQVPSSGTASSSSPCPSPVSSGGLRSRSNSGVDDDGRDTTGASSSAAAGSTIKRRRTCARSPSLHPSPESPALSSPHSGAASQLARSVSTGSCDSGSSGADTVALGVVNLRLSVASSPKASAAASSASPSNAEFDHRGFVQRIRMLESTVAHLPPFDSDNLTPTELQELYMHLHAVTSELGPWQCLVNIDLGPDTKEADVRSTAINHACSDGGCHYLYNYREMYTCLLSGRMHMCTQYTCKLAVQGVECRTCPLTCKPYTLDYTWSWEEGNKSSAYKAQVNVRVAGGTTKQHHRKHRVAASDTEACQTRYTGITPDRVEEFTSFVSSLLGRQKLPHDRCEALAREIMRLQVDYLGMCTPPMGYDDKFHTFLMLRLMAAGGCHYKGHCYVKPHMDVTDAMDANETETLLRMGKNPKFSTQRATDFQRTYELSIQKRMDAEIAAAAEAKRVKDAKAEAIAAAEALYQKQKARYPATPSLLITL